MLQFVIFQMMYLTLICVLGSGSALIFFFAQAIVSVFMLESIAYTKHYGLLRDSETKGGKSKFAPMHSWDCYYRFSNYLEFQLQRHADHHAAPTKSQEELQVWDSAPRLRAGYSVMISIALIPALWRRVMHPLLREAGEKGETFDSPHETCVL